MTSSKHRDASLLVCLLSVAALGLAGSLPPASAAPLYDLTADWSDTANPNGPWAYREGTNLLPHVDAWQGLSGDFTSAQPAWARFDVGTSNLPCFFRSSASVGIAHDWQAGDVVCHSTDGFNGIGSGHANITPGPCCGLPCRTRVGRRWASAMSPAIASSSSRTASPPQASTR